MKEKLGFWERLKNLFCKKKEEETKAELVENLGDNPLDESEKDELIRLESEANDGQKIDYLKTMLYIAYARDAVYMSNAMDCPQLLAIDKIKSYIQSPQQNTSEIRTVTTKLVRMNSTDMKMHIKEFLKRISDQQRQQVYKACQNSIDDVPLTLTSGVDSYMSLIKDDIMPLFGGEHENSEI